MTRLPKGSVILEQRDGVALVGLPQDPRKRYPLWNINALERDIASAEANIRSFREAIAEQERVIGERREQIKVCEERDRAIEEWERNRADSDISSG
jgi:hypothetical protein